MSSVPEQINSSSEAEVRIVSGAEASRNSELKNEEISGRKKSASEQVGPNFNLLVVFWNVVDKNQQSR